MIPTRTAAALVLCVPIGLCTPASAAEDSAYTDLNVDECTVLEADDFGVNWACPGYKGYPVYVAEGDLRFFVSYGFGAPDEKAAEQTLPQFNTLGGKIEWRLTNQTGRWMPFATIVRYFLDDPEGSDENRGQVLVVTKLEPGNTCQIAHIDAKLVPNANEEARKWADETARDFNCETDEIAQIPS